MPAQKKILLTRPRASSERWAALLARHGFDSLIEPLLTIDPLPTPRPPGFFQACFITSANALDALEELKPPVADLLSLPCFCIGASTAEAARLFGFANIRCGASDSAALAQLAAKTLTDKNHPLLHIAGDITDGKAADILAQNGFTLTAWTIYHARATEDFTPATRDAFRAGEIAALLVFSPRSARVLLSIIEKNGLARSCHGIAAIGLSQAVADVLKLLPWRRVRFAASPSEENVLASLQTEFPMTQTEPMSPPPPANPSCEIGSSCGKVSCTVKGLSIVFLFVAAIIGFAAFAKRTWLHPAPVLVQTQAAPDNAALEQRVAALERQFAALAEIPAVAPTTTATGANDATATNTIKNLESQIAQLQNQGKDGQRSTRKLISFAFAFWDMREAAENGRSFATQLAALRAASVNDAAMAEQIAKLEPYAANPPPTLPQLRGTLAAQEAAIPTRSVPGDETSLWNRIAALFRPLISVHPLHNPGLVPLEKALDSGDAQAASDMFKALPADTQTKLSAWQADLEARNLIDAALRAMAASFTSAPAENAP